VRQIKYEQQRDRENATHEREKLLLRLENALLRFERRLPPGQCRCWECGPCPPGVVGRSRSHLQAARALQNPRSCQVTVSHAGEFGRR
jgi:hypothetical protein